jgi:hypothetical protein
MTRLTRLAVRCACWYLSPSGLILLAGLSLVAVSMLTDQSAPGVAGIALLAFFFPYRSMREREQTRTQTNSMVESQVGSLTDRVASVHTQLENDAAVSTHALSIVNRRLDEIDRRLSAD